MIINLETPLGAFQLIRMKWKFFLLKRLANRSLTGHGRCTTLLIAE